MISPRAGLSLTCSILWNNNGLQKKDLLEASSNRCHWTAEPKVQMSKQ